MARNFLTPINLNKLELQNAAIQNLATAPSAPVQGQVYYDTVEDKIKVFNGSTWDTVGNTTEEIQDVVGGLLAAGTGIGVSYNDAGNSLTISNTGILSVVGTANEVDVSTTSGSVTVSLPTTINADTTGNAATSTALQTARVISLTGNASGSASFDGTANISIPVTLNSSSNVSSITGTANEVDVSASVGAVVVSLPTTINANTTGNAATATALATARNIALSGVVSGSASFDGTANAAITTVLANDSVTLGTHTTGNYVASISGTANEVSVSGSGEGASVTIGLPDDVVITNSLTVQGALTVSGSATYVNTEILTVNDNIIILNNNEAGTPSQNAGVEVERGTSTNVSVLWNETNDNWTLTNDGTTYHPITRKYEEVLSTSATSYTITHNLNTRAVLVNVYTNSGVYDTVEVDVERTDANTVTLRFASAPSSNAYAVVVVG